MRPEDVLEVMDLLGRAGVRAWVAGGWGVDALLGERTRPHRDLDVAIDRDDESASVEALEKAGFAILASVDWRPSRFAMQDPVGRRVDLHPVAFGPGGAGRQANLADLPPFEYPANGFSRGRIAGRRVPCISAELQASFHVGYPMWDSDRRDMELLRERFGVGSDDAS
jgi:lincosamide nucleotidyltransferase A/C/D/E